jgi:hypothetical protein
MVERTKAARMAYSHLLPGMVKIWKDHRKMVSLFKKLENEGHISSQKREELTKASRTIRNFRLMNYIGRIIAAEAYYELCAKTYGVGARDWQLDFSQLSQAKDTSLTAAVLAAKISAMIPDSMADALRWIEIGFDGARAAFEQWYFRKIGIVVDPAAILLNPINAFVLEVTYKLAATQPADDATKKYVHTLNILGNVIRVFVNDLLVVGLIGKGICGIDYRTMAIKHSARYKNAVDILAEATEVDIAIERYINFNDY